MTGSTTYRGIQIVAADLPSGPFSWIDDESDMGGTAATLDEARRQIGRYLGPRGGAEPCPECCGHAALDWAHLSIERCPWCSPEEEEAA
ncbi:hypothetical protein [Paracoccus siganidrum]|uniref:Uncharacterized protein n=1 Tax=Paracoccus siganidrum TaxID=1276757 RepID=A0A419A8B6_9RHOB|nr:hypothetical protein [Paracoccus siganidrum]RJL18231.1 hypothetical protein D3P05_07775 [Paracoccus siganidrum]RMC33408.1 hypothetical protein C9E82_13235 [Paracoccus siganidrum]